MGRSDCMSCRSLLRQALRHMLKAEAWPLSRDAPNWRADAIEFRRQAGRFVPRCAEDHVADLSDALPRCPRRWTASRRCRCRRVSGDAGRAAGGRLMLPVQPSLRWLGRDEACPTCRGGAMRGPCGRQPSVLACSAQPHRPLLVPNMAAD